MTKFRFIRSLIKTIRKGDWMITCQYIRTRGDFRHCPLSFTATELTGRTFSSLDYMQAADALNIDPPTRDLVVGAADAWKSYTALPPQQPLKGNAYERLRKIMLKALHL